MKSSIDLAHRAPLSSWSPQIGDFVIWHGWFQHYFGVISGISKESNQVEVIKKGLPLLLFAMVEEEYDKNKLKIDIGTIKGSANGEYAIVRAVNNTLVWFV